jgi:hypothetical protein
MQSFSGKQVFPLEFKPEQVTFEDIAHSLAQKVRFNGHLREMGYTVAQHCVMGAEQLSGSLALAFVLHEVDEVYLPDVPSPIKPYLRISSSIELGRIEMTWDDLCAQHGETVFRALRLEALWNADMKHDAIKETDIRMLLTEKRDLMGEGPGVLWEAEKVSQYKPFGFRIDRVWSMPEAKERFTQAYRVLRRNCA